MKLDLPSQQISLPGGYTWDPRAVSVSAWQAHVLKHPLGLRAVRDFGPDWDQEGWSNTEPPVVDAPERDHVFEQIRRLSTGAQPCRVPEVFGVAAPAESDKPECYECRGPLVARCFETLLSAGISARYAAQTEAVVAALRGGVIVDRVRLARALSRGVQRAEVWRDLVVMAGGKLGKSQREGLRLTRGDGVRVELKLIENHGLKWRTTYRLPLVSGRSGGWGYLLQTPDKGAQTLLSDAYVVPRAWWETHGN